MKALFRLGLFIAPLSILIALSLICVETVPVYTNFDPAENEGKRVQLGMIKIIEKKPDHYVVYVNNDAPVRIKVVCAGNFSVGDIVTFEGPFYNGTLYAEKYHLHDSYEYPFVVSFIGLGIILILLYREWKFDLSRMQFIPRKNARMRRGD